VTEPVILGSARFRQLLETIFRRLCVPEAELAIVVDALLEASLAGYDSHGVMRVPVFVDGIREGSMVPGAGIRILREGASAAHLDANRCLGPVGAVHAVRTAVEKAAATGIGCVTVINGNDVARLGSYVAEPARAGFLVLMAANDGGGNPAVAPWGGTQPFLSTNPIAAGIPRSGAVPIVIDLSTSVVAEGQVRMKRNRGESTPDEWLIDGNGNTTRDPAMYFSRPRRAALRPLGGLNAGHKGFALGVLVEALAGALSGAGCSSGEFQDAERNGLFVLAVDPEKFDGRAGFVEHIDRFVRGVKQVRRLKGVDEILLPGEGSARRRKRREEQGIPVDTGTWARIREILRSLDIESEEN
jgi:uncharacterized oxidoreductase